MSWFQTDLKAPPQASSGLIQLASQSPLRAVSDTMGELMDIVDTRAKEKYTTGALESLKEAKSMQDIQSLGIDVSRLSDAGKQQYASSLDLINKIGQEEQRDLNTQLALADANLKGEKFALDVEEAELNRKVKLAQIAKANRIEAPETVQEMRMLGYDLTPDGYSQYINAKAKNSTRKPTAYEERDRYFYEAQQIKNIPEEKRTTEQQERLELLDNTLLGSVAGKSEVKEKLDESQLLAGVKEAEDLSPYLEKPTGAKQTTLGRMKRVENSYFKNTETQQSKSTQGSIDTMKANQLVVDSIGKVFDDISKNPSKYDRVKKGVVDDFVQGTRKMFGSVANDNQLKAMEQNIDFNTRAGRILTSFIKATSGLTVSDKERAFLQDILLGGNLSDEKAVMSAMKSFRQSVASESDLIAGQIYTDAPYSATKYRQYKYSTPQYSASTGVTRQPKGKLDINKYKNP